MNHISDFLEGFQAQPDEPRPYDAQLIVSETTWQHESGRTVVRFQASLKPDCCSHGSLSFAFWEAWKDEPETFAKAKSEALSAARKVLAAYAKL